MMIEALYFFDKGGEKISSDGTDLTINSGNDINLQQQLILMLLQT